jgi:hypothetical protein
MNAIRSGPVRLPCRPVAGMSFLVLFVLGCSGLGDVSGTVTYQNKPVLFGTVLIECADGSIRQGNIEKDGSYTVRGVAAGDVKVAVNSPNPKGVTILPSKIPERKQEPYPVVPGWFPIPRKYDSPSTSGLTYQVRGGANTINIELK